MMLASLFDDSNSDDNSKYSEDTPTKDYPNPKKKGKNSSDKKDDEFKSQVAETFKKGKISKGSLKKKGGYKL